MKILFNVLDFLFPATMNFIWGVYFLVWCHKNGVMIFGAGSKEEAMEYLNKPL